MLQLYGVFAVGKKIGCAVLTHEHFCDIFQKKSEKMKNAQVINLRTQFFQTSNTP